MNFDDILLYMVFLFISSHQFAESPAQECSRNRAADVQLRGAGHVLFLTTCKVGPYKCSYNLYK